MLKPQLYEACQTGSETFPISLTGNQDQLLLPLLLIGSSDIVLVCTTWSVF